ncbi:aminoacyl-tRNA hydrolase [Pseudolysinimonas sp.]|uniref:aminoacyl-tRNA hydrolase n=1 Tax=Pseudolysinimonas sp. TaxID=2680009 RepID=UPI003F7DDA3D
MADDLWLVVGLGNPGPGYAGHRHNVAQMALDELASRIGATFKRHKTNAAVAEGRIAPGGARLVLAKPATFMNTSGGPVAQLVRFYSLAADRVVVLHDELDIPFDTIKLKVGGGHGGHNGLRDIASALGTPDFARVRIGIGRPPGRQDPADFVLSPFSKQEREVLPSVLSDAADATELLITDGLVAAQQRFHSPA